jgi:hypothetical protein
MRLSFFTIRDLTPLESLYLRIGTGPNRLNGKNLLEKSDEQESAGKPKAQAR